MALQVYTVTLAGTTTPVQLSATRQPFHSMRIESDASNAIAYFGKAGVTTSVYAGTVLANTATITITINADAAGTLRYAYNNGTANNVGGTTGARGNIRDSAAAVTEYDATKLYNWLCADEWVVA